MLTKHPIIANGVSGATFATVGDISCQKGIEGCFELDVRRCMAFGAFGFVYTGAVCNTLYSTYIHVLPAALLRMRGGEALGSTLLDNFVHLPLLYVPSFYVAVGFMQGQSRDEVASELRARYSETVVSSWAYWIPFMGANFGLVPPALRTVVMQGGDFVWTIILSYISHRELDNPVEPATAALLPAPSTGAAPQAAASPLSSEVPPAPPPAPEPPLPKLQRATTISRVADDLHRATYVHASALARRPTRESCAAPLPEVPPDGRPNGG